MNSFDSRKEGEAEVAAEVYSKAVRAGRRTYFFDVKVARNDDYYLTITESRKRAVKDGGSIYEKHTIYLYKEDFNKFEAGFGEVVRYVKKHKPECFEPDGGVVCDMSSAGGEFDKL